MIMKIVFLISAALILGVCEGPPSPELDHSRHDHAQSTHGLVDHSKMESSPGAAQAPFELQFIDSMIAHHQGAVEMALLADTRTRRDEIRSLAEKIIKDQRAEIEKMRTWRQAWFGDASQAVNLDFPGMRAGMSGMDTLKLASLKAHEFDVEFLRQMVPHHEGALAMAKVLQTGGKRPELIELSDSIIQTQAAEIAEMNALLDRWSKTDK